MEQFQFSELPISIRLVYEFQDILGTVTGWVIRLNLAPSIVTPVTRHPLPQPFDDGWVHWRDAG